LAKLVLKSLTLSRISFVGCSKLVLLAVFSPNGSRREEERGADNVDKSDGCNLLAAFLTEPR
jgi:hypothetical protein